MLTLGDPLLKREEFAVSLRRLKKANILKEKRKKYEQTLEKPMENVGNSPIGFFSDYVDIDFVKKELRPNLQKSNPKAQYSFV